MTRTTYLRDNKAADDGENNEQRDSQVLEMLVKGMMIERQ